MFRRLITAVLGAALLATLTVTPAAAKRPSPPPAEAERPLTAEEQLASDAKIAAAEAYIASVEADGSELSTLSCVYPVSMPGDETVSGDPSTSDDAGTDDDVTIQACSTPSGSLSVEARDQTKGHYCGPAVGQVIANYAWKMASGANKYSQAKIAGWMQTDTKGYTNAPELAYGLDVATTGAPRRPANWKWVVSPLRDTDGDGVVGDQLQEYVRANVSGSKMPLAFAVKPYDKNSKYHLSSWSKPVNTIGHWIAGYGWFSYWTGTDYARIYYTDSSRDEGGSTGKFWDPTRHVAALIMEHTQRFVW